MTSDVQENAALSLLRFVTRALVQEPPMWRFILERADKQATKLGSETAVKALQAFREAFGDNAPAQREQLERLAKTLNKTRAVGDDPRSLAGQTLQLALDEIPSRPVAQ